MPEDRVFLKEALKEPKATSITVKDLLLSIISDESSTVNSDTPGGDSFSQAGLAGISEINEDNPEILQKYHINAPDKMMDDITGLIFENRMAQKVKLSKMPEIYQGLSNILKQVNTQD